MGFRVGFTGALICLVEPLHGLHIIFILMAMVFVLVFHKFTSELVLGEAVCDAELYPVWCCCARLLEPFSDERAGVVECS